MMPEMLLLLASAALGLLLGAHLMEAYVFVPYWKSLSGEDFFAFYQRHGDKIHRFFAPLTIVATLLNLGAAASSWWLTPEGQLLSGGMGLATLAYFSTYFLYFQQANQGFSKGKLSDEELSTELNLWARWHWGRISLEGVAFGIALLLLLKN